MTLCRIYNLTPFSLFKEDSEEVIMLINYLIEKSGENKNNHQNTYQKKEERIRVNDKTATGGWY